MQRNKDEKENDVFLKKKRKNKMFDTLTKIRRPLALYLPSTGASF